MAAARERHAARHARRLLRRHGDFVAGRAGRGAPQTPRAARPAVRRFTENLRSYAIGRRVEYFDEPAIRAIARTASTSDYKMSSFIMGVITSDAFRMKRADVDVTEADKSDKAKEPAKPKA